MSMRHILEHLLDETRTSLPFWITGGYGDVKETLGEMVCLPLQKPEPIRQHNPGLPAGMKLWRPLGSKITSSAEACARQSGALIDDSSGQDMPGTHNGLQVVFGSAIHEASCVLFGSACERLAQAGASVIRVASGIESRWRQAGSKLG